MITTPFVLICFVLICFLFEIDVAQHVAATTSLGKPQLVQNVSTQVLVEIRSRQRGG